MSIQAASETKPAGWLRERGEASLLDVFRSIPVAAGDALAQVPGLPRAGLSRRRRLHGPRQLGDLARRRLASSATRCWSSRCSPTSWRSCCRRSARGSPSAPAAISRRPAATPSRARSPGRSGCWPRSRSCATDLAEVIGTAIGLNLLFGIPLEIGVAHHRARRVPDPLAADASASAGSRRFIIALLGVIAVCFARPDRAWPIPDWGGGHPRLRADHRDRHQPGHALSRARHPRRDGDAAQSLPAFRHRADARLSARRCRRSARR